MPRSTKIIDLFTEPVSDTNLESHLTDTPALGTWSVNVAAKLLVLAASDELSSDGTNNRRIGQVDFSAGTDQLIVSGSCLCNFQANTRKVGFMVRMQSANLSNGYEVLIEGNGTSGDKQNDYLVNKMIASTRTTLITWSDTANNNGASYHHLEFQCLDPIKILRVDQITRGTSADNNLTGNFYAGVQMQQSDPRMTNFLVEDSTGTAASVAMQEASFIFAIA